MDYRVGNDGVDKKRSWIVELIDIAENIATGRGRMDEREEGDESLNDGLDRRNDEHS